MGICLLQNILKYMTLACLVQCHGIVHVVRTTYLDQGCAPRQMSMGGSPRPPLAGLVASLPLLALSLHSPCWPCRFTPLAGLVASPPLAGLVASPHAQSRAQRVAQGRCHTSTWRRGSQRLTQQCRDVERGLVIPVTEPRIRAHIAVLDHDHEVQTSHL